MKNNYVDEAMLLKVVENEFVDQNEQVIKWYFADFIVDTDVLRMKVNSQKLEEINTIPSKQFINIEYTATHKLVSEDGTKYTTIFEFVGVVPFNDKKNKKGEN